MRLNDEREMSEPFQISVFTIEADRKPIIVFAAKKHEDAETFIKDERIRTGLMTTTAAGVAIVDQFSILRVRLADATERALYREKTAGTENPGVVFLIDVDEAPTSHALSVQ